MKSAIIPAIILCLFAAVPMHAQYDSTYYIVDTGQLQCYNNSGPMSAPSSGQAFFGQDAQHAGNQPQYVDNGDGTISDPVTGLMWVKDRGSKMSWELAAAGAASCAVGGYTDWRMPTIKELYSLIDFNGKSGSTAANSVPYINTTYFGFAFGNTALGERLIDCQDWSATTYVHLTMGGDTTAFGVNFADGRIKGYPKPDPMQGGRKQMYVRYVRGNASYGVNNFVDNNDSTVTDRATGLMWMKADSRGGMNWEEALAWVQTKNAAAYLGYSDWRLPNAKELQSIVDYTRSPATSSSAAIDPVFFASSIGGGEYPFYWTSTTHREGPPTSSGGNLAAYVCFGRATGWMQQPPNSQNYVLMDVHGAGAQRSDPKSGNPASYPYGNGPQGDVVRIYNYVRLVRGGNVFIPVELSSLRATALPAAMAVRLEWSTATETNNLGFAVQRRSDDAVEWEEIPGSFTAGHGTTNETQQYAYIDHPPYTGSWQYRLRQMDTDGTQEFSRTVFVNVGAQPATMQIAASPNPTAGQTTLRFTLSASERVTITVTDLLGRELLRCCDLEYRTAGTHAIAVTMQNLPRGIYLLRLSTSSAAVTSRLLLQ